MLTYHYSNPKFKDLPWSIDGKKKKKKRHKRQKNKKLRLHKNRLRQLLPQRKGAEIRCKKYLETFWKLFNATQTDSQRLQLLKQAANPGWDRIDELIRKNLRNQFSRYAFRLLAIPIEKCATCDNAPQEKHHIVPLCFGGINEEINLILICFDCHCAIHPWMVANEPT